MTGGIQVRLPVHRPLMPAAERLLPYLRRIDENRWYSNHGPLAVELRERLAAHYRIRPGCVQPVASGTAGIMGVLMALDLPRGSLCMLPSWTFVATGHAAAMAGLVPYLVDVDERSWALTPEIAEKALARAPGHVAAVIPVAPFGAPLDPAPWAAFRKRTGVAVVIDAAAGFDTVKPSPLPTVVSLHATKVLGAGEGGFVLCRDIPLIEEVVRRTNFGFLGSRRVASAAFNGKISEYHAAVALAGLDDWPQTRAAFAAVCRRLADKVGALPGVELLPDYGRTWVSSMFPVRLRGHSAADVGEALAEAGIDTRRWWEDGLHAEEAFRHCPRTDLPVTETLAREVLGLPCFVDQTERESGAVADVLADMLRLQMRRRKLGGDAVV